ncbi:hypothetical protein Nepgr_029807 [Nepenthes gracilis]|uniref:Uncharacterized protein n=1 Tax=Nepenthes gracilis TaxID=150966 RepID=A0AAD3TF29_NEPGR|nr:hypothetical protein Nepgr_029807 [Nepenthes gracilis]
MAESIGRNGKINFTEREIWKSLEDWNNRKEGREEINRPAEKDRENQPKLAGERANLDLFLEKNIWKNFEILNSVL